ncbi:MAG: sigma-70 family RNA polymerase sigma factor [Sedimentibacter saalensis]|uniref:RNA polymerase sigma factor n=1 Tax=Sedimentibacter saalensis TaxID=130788 RepID=UPI003158D2A2
MVADKLLIVNLKKGREDAYRQIVEEYGNRLLRTCYLILKDREEAEDVVQETFIKVFRNIDSFRENSGLYTWIYTIALNLSRDRLRKKQDMLALEDEQVGNSDVDYEVEKGIDRELLRKELFSINPLYREVLVLFYFEELSIKHISNLLNEKEGTIKSKLSRGRSILKKGLLNGGSLNG